MYVGVQNESYGEVSSNSQELRYLAGRAFGKMITCCLNCTSRCTACHDTCEKYKAEKKDFEERKAFVYELNHSQSVYRRNYEDKHRERDKKRYLGSEFRGER